MRTAIANDSAVGFHCNAHMYSSMSLAFIKMCIQCVECLFIAGYKTVWPKQLQQWTIEKVACKKLMQQVLEMRKKQIEYKCELLSLGDICWQEISVAALNLSSPTVSVLAM